jgi:hypothetical protein
LSKKIFDFLRLFLVKKRVFAGFKKPKVYNKSVKKYQKTLSLFGISLVSLGGVSALMLPLTSCGGDEIPKAPDTFTFTDDYTKST